MGPAFLIDLTRTASRLGHGAFTGIDRVELAWAQHLLSLNAPLHGLVRLRYSFALLDRAGIAALCALAHRNAPLAPPDALSRLIWRKDAGRARAEAATRRLAALRVLVPGLARALGRMGPQTYLNFGHANLTPRVLQSVKAAGGQVQVMIHDVIPLTHPQFTRAGIPQVFERKLAAVSALADRVVHLTDAARSDTEAHLARLGRLPPGLTAPLGVTLAAPDASLLPRTLDLSSPIVLALGTIEPRKNLSLLADVWALGGPLPRLVVVGHKGWDSDDLYHRLQNTSGVVLAGPLPDGAVAALMQQARALVFPTLTEGYGLPPLEALARGLPVFCADIPVLREVLSNAGDGAVYLGPKDVYAWHKAMQSLVNPDKHGTTPQRQLLPVAPPDWAPHFNAVLSNVG